MEEGFLRLYRIRQQRYLAVNVCYFSRKRKNDSKDNSEIKRTATLNTSSGGKALPLRFSR